MTSGGFPHLHGVKKREALCESQNHRCAYCGIKCEGEHVDDDAPTIDEVIPRCIGGRQTWDNQVLACRRCNNGRGAIDAMVYFERVLTMGRDEAYKWGRAVAHFQSREYQEERARIKRERAARKAAQPEHVPISGGWGDDG